MNKYVARQPIKNMEEGNVVGYEVLFQHDHDALYNGPDYEAADTIAAFLMQNNGKIFHDKLTFVTFTPSLLFRNVAQMFDKDKLVIQLEDNLIIHPLASVMVKKYSDLGYQFAIDNFQFSPKYFAMLEYVQYIKIDVHRRNDPNQRKTIDELVNMMTGFGKKCIITGVNTVEEFESAKAMGAGFVEGNYIAGSTLTKYKKMDYLEGNFYQLVVEVSKDEADIDVIEHIISRDTALVYGLLKVVNSAHFASRRKISSIRQALVTMGISQLKQWVYLLSVTEDGGQDLEDFLKLSFLRASFTEALANRIQDLPISPSEAYVMGMFSTLEYMVDAPMVEILNDIPIAEEIKEALIHESGICGKLHKLVLEYEKANWKEIKELSMGLGIPANFMAQAYMDCVETVNQIWDNLVSATEEEGAKS